MDDDASEWFAVWIKGLSKERVTIESLGEDSGGTVVISHGDMPLVGMQGTRVTAYV